MAITVTVSSSPGSVEPASRSTCGIESTCRISLWVKFTEPVRSSVPRSPVGIRQLPVMSTPWVRVSTPLVKYWTPPIPVTPGVGQHRERGVVVEGRAEDDAVVDVDVEHVRRHRQVVHRGEGEAGAQVDRGLLLERPRAQRQRGRVVHREDPHLHELVGDHVGDHLVERHLAQAGRPEAGARGAPEHHPPRGLVAERHLAGELLAEVVVGLEPGGDVRQQLGREIGLRVGVEAEVVPVPLGRVVRREAGEARRARRRDGGAVLVQVEAVDLGGQLTLADLVALPAEGGAEGEVERRGQPDLDRPGHVDGGDELLAQQPAREELGLVGNARIVGRAQDAGRVPGRRGRRGRVPATRCSSSSCCSRSRCARTPRPHRSSSRRPRPGARRPPSSRSPRS